MSESDAQRIYEKLDAMNRDLAALVASTKHIASSTNDHEARLRVLESWQWKVIGIATAIGAIASLAVALLAK